MMKQQSRFWRNPIVDWVYLNIPDIIGLIVIAMIAWGLWVLMSWLVEVFGKTTGFG